jgi:hypothetical protein
MHKEYEWEPDSFGGVVLRETSVREIYLQPGDDANQFMAEVDKAAEYDKEADLVQDYFDCIN